MKTGKTSTKEEFIEKSILKHGLKFDYSKTVYKNNYSKILIICPQHGEFEQKPVDHLRSKGCKRCSIGDKAKNQRITKEEFIKRANEKHNFKYDYSLIEYVDDRTKIVIVCPTHGEFEQVPNNHTRGYGCPRCKLSKGELKIREYLINNSIKFEEQKRFDDCKQNKKLPFDFYLPDKNLLIEYDGIGHYKPTTFGGCSKEDAIKNLVLQKEKDKIKTEYATKKKIKLLRISYIKEKNIDKLLDIELNVNNNKTIKEEETKDEE